MTDILIEADRLIVAWSGVQDWRPLFATGAGFVFVVGFIAGLLLVASRR